MKVAVVGAGIVGRLMAWRLTQVGCQVSVFDQHARQDHANCSFAAAGMLSPFAEVETALNGVVRLGQASLAIWRTYWDALGDGFLYGDKGSLLLSHPQDRAEINRFMGVLKSRTRNITDANTAYTCLSDQSLSSIEPDLAGFVGEALLFDQEGFVDPVGIMDVLAEHLLSHGVDWHEKTSVTSTQPYRVVTEHHQLEFDWVFDCRGLGAKDHFSELRGVRGEALILHAPDFNLTRPLRLLHPRYRLYVVPRSQNCYVVGASEIESEDYRAVTVRTLMELLSSLYSILPEFAEASLVKTMVHCRPALPDNMPAVRCQPGLVGINGLYRHGYLMAPWLVESGLNFAINQQLNDNIANIIQEVAV